MISFRNSKQDSSLFQAQFALSFFTTLLRPDANAALALLGLFGSFYLKRDPKVEVPKEEAPKEESSEEVKG